MTLHLFYRAAPGGNRKLRPEWFSKWICLATLLRSVEATDRTTAELHFVCDGELPAAVSALMRDFGTVDVLPGLGNSLSYLRVVEAATNVAIRDSDGVYFVEDDYLHVPDAVRILGSAVAELDRRTYLTLYDHPDRYSRTDDLNASGPGARIWGDHHWRRVESTNMTYATTAGTLRDDRHLHWAFARFTKYPHDRALWRTLQGLGSRRAVGWVRGRSQLWSAVPGLATHAELDCLAPLIDWQLAADGARSWLSAAGRPQDVGW